MTVLLVNPPRTDQGVSELAPPLGLARLARSAQDSGVEAGVLDLNLLWHVDESLRAAFFPVAVRKILDRSPTVLGLTSMAIDSHVALELGRLVKEQSPETRVCLGGPHFSAAARAFLRDYPFVDRIARGTSAAEFFELIGASHATTAYPQPDVYASLDAAPYFGLNSTKLLDFEASRGCVYSCSFCFSPVHHGRPSYRGVDDVVREVTTAREKGAQHLFFVDDNFVNDRSRALELCSALEAASLGLTWHCYATFPQLDTKLTAALARAGCNAIFTGIDAVGARSQGVYSKRFVRRSTPLAQRLEMIADHGITPTCAFLVAPPSHECGVDFEETLQVALTARSTGARVRLNVLTFYPGTPIPGPSRVFPDSYRASLQLDVPDFVATNPYADRAPHLFPFHFRYVEEAEWREFCDHVHIMFTLLHARCDELLDGGFGLKNGLLNVARDVAAEVGPLLSYPKSDRRRVATLGFDRVLRSSAA